jgi:hypothetical protein
MIGSNSKRLFIANTVKKKYNSRATLSLNLEPIQKGDSPATNENIILTDGMYYLRYEPVKGGKNFADKPYVIKSDLFTIDKKRVNGYTRLIMMTKKDRVVDFFVKFSNISEKTFGIAKANPGLQVPVCLDYVKYRMCMEEKYPDINCKQIFREVYEDDD